LTAETTLATSTTTTTAALTTTKTSGQFHQHFINAFAPIILLQKGKT
jgi:hypothetical protein